MVVPSHDGRVRLLMTHTTTFQFCKKCQSPLPANWLSSDNTDPCPSCGSLARDIRIGVELDLSSLPHYGTRIRSKDPSLPSKQKLRYDQFVGEEFTKSTGAWSTKVRVIDKDDDYYRERVVDQATGHILTDQEGRLSDHIGHGSAKQKK